MRGKFLCAVTILGLALSAPAGGLAFTFTTIDVPGASNTQPFGINNARQIVGVFVDATGTHGFLKDGASFTTIDVPGAFRTQASGINNAGQIVGLFFDVTDDTGAHGFATEAAVLTVAIDIKPGSFPNSINLGSGGLVPVAILSNADFDATTVDPSTVTLAGAQVALKGKGTLMSSVEDVNGDGLLDLVVHVRTDALQVTQTDTEAILQGETLGGTPIEGTDSVRIVK